MRGSETRGNEPDGGGLQAQLDSFLTGQKDRLIAFRRDLHMHPELGFAEHRTTARIAEELGEAGLRPTLLPKGTGLMCEVGCGDGPIVALRADIDALPLPDEKDVPYRSTVPGVAHACGHDVHT
ncbi:MAG: M20/M25/M40 family metallo-hydrolase, partial [Actinoallomurus sp.]